MGEAKTVLDVLVAARELISVPERWTRGSYARDIDGRQRGAKSDYATCWCASGAIERVAGDATFFGLQDKAWKALASLSGGSVATFNDDQRTTHADVLELFDRAIADERAKVSP